MDIGQILDQTRSDYLEQFREVLTKIADSGQSAVAEAAYRNEEGELAVEGLLSLPLRGDIFVITDGEQPKSVSVDSEAVFSFEPFSIEFSDNLTLQMAPFYWDACNIYASGISQQADWSHLKTWFTKWFDVEDQNSPDAQGFLGVVHFLSDPKLDGFTTEFQVDFGSAAVESFAELLHALKAAGATKVQIGSR